MIGPIVLTIILAALLVWFILTIVKLDKEDRDWLNDPDRHKKSNNKK
jgi:hypothetical protein